MRGSRVATGALVTGAFAVASLFAAAPASAASLPPGQRVDVIDYSTAQYYEVDAPTGGLTLNGTASVVGDFRITGVDVDAQGHGYAVGTNYSDGPIDGALFVADANTGTLTNGKTLNFIYNAISYNADECLGIDYTAGVIIASCVTYLGEDALSIVGIVDPSDGSMETILLSAGFGPLSDWLRFNSLATDPVSGLLYAATNNESVPRLYTVSESGTDFVGDLEYAYDGMDFDRSGQLWATIQLGDTEGSALVTVGLADGSITSTAPFSGGGHPTESTIAALTIWGALPATGPADSAVPLVGAALLLMLGTILAGLTALRRRSVNGH